MDTKPENLEILKEQLRNKNRELKQKDADRAKLEEKVRHALTANDQTISTLKTQLKEKDEIIKRRDLAINSATARAVRAESMQEKAAEAAGTAGGEKGGITANDPRVVELIKGLRAKNDELSTRMNMEIEQKNKLSLDRQTLLRELQRLRGDPGHSDKLKQKIGLLEARFQEVQAQYEKSLQEKNEIIISYERIIEDGKMGTAGGGIEPLPRESIEEVKRELETVRKENLEMNKQLHERKKQFDQRLAKEMQRLADEWESKVTTAKKTGRGKGGDIMEEKADDEPHAPLWMITFSDFSGLLLTFFVLLYTMAAKNTQIMKTAILGEENASIGMLELLDTVEVKDKLKNLSGMQQHDLLSDLNKTVQKEKLESQMSVSTDHAKIIVRVPGGTLFAPGKADLQKEGRPVLDEIIAMTKTYPEYKIGIQGHTDDTLITTAQFPSNWELSAARATAVLRYFIDKGIEPTKLTATGFADIFPVASNETEAGKAQNRRVEIVLEKEKR